MTIEKANDLTQDRKGRRKLFNSLHLPQEAEESTIQEVQAIRLSSLQRTSQ